MTFLRTSILKNIYDTTIDISISIKGTSKMSDGRKQILSPFMGVKNEKLGIRLEKNICW